MIKILVKRRDVESYRWKTCYEVERLEVEDLDIFLNKLNKVVHEEMKRGGQLRFNRYT